jgi:hypothetical protein
MILQIPCRRKKKIVFFGDKAITIQKVITVFVFLMVWAKERNAKKLTLRAMRHEFGDMGA